MPYTKKQRSDKGFDFFDPNGKKITIEQYTQGTGENGSELRKNLANAGDKQSVNMLRSKTPIENLADFSRTLGAGFQQTAGSIADLAIQGGGLITDLGIKTNPLTNSRQKAAATLNFDKSLAGGGSSEYLRKLLQSQTDIEGKKIIGTSDVDQSATNIATGRATPSDVLNVAGKAAQLGIDATSLLNPVALARGAGAKQVAKTAVRDAAFYGGTQGLATGAQVLGQTGDIKEALKKGGEAALLSGVTQGALDVAVPLSKAIVKGTKKAATSNPAREAATQHPAVLQYDAEYNNLAQKYDTLPAGSSARRDVSKAMAQLMVEKTNTRKAIERRVAQTGSIKIPGKNDLETSIPAGRGLGPVAQEGISSQPINVKQYVAEQRKAQEAARKSASLSGISKAKNEISTKLIDSFAPIEDTLKRANKNGAGIQISDANHITPQLDRAIRADTIAGQYINDKGLAKVIQSVPDTSEFDQYLIAKHAADLEANGVKTGRNLDADAQLVQQLDTKYGQQAAQIKQYNDGLLDLSVEYGLISKDLADGLKKKYPNYVPANRIFGEDEINTNKLRGGGKASIGQQTVVQRIKGSERDIESPLASIANKTTDVIAQGERNKAASILASYKDLPDNPFNLREMKPDETVGAKSVISYLDNGKVRRFETTPEIAAAAKALNKEQIGLLGKIVRIPTRVLRLGATGVNVGFTLANIAKDLVSAAVNSEHPLRASVFNPAVMRRAAASALNHNSKSYKELVREGAGGTSFDIARDAPVQTVKRIRSEKNAATNIAYTVTHPGELLRAVENIIGRSEEFSRALQYYGNKEAALAKGLNESDAVRYGAHSARNNTVNFARAGEWGAVLNSALPYLNAGIQGARTFNRSLVKHPAQTLTKVALLGTLPVLTTTAWNLADPERLAAYNDISDYEKEGNIIIIPPHPVKDPETGRWNVIKIPVSQEIAGLNNIARTALETATGNGEINIAKTLGDLIGTTTSIDTGSFRDLSNKVIPQALKPAIETLTNENLYSGNQIVPDNQKNLPAADQYGEYTSGTAKVIGKLTNISPRVIDNAIKTSAGGAGQNIVNKVDAALAATGVIDPSEVQGKTIEESVTGRFFGATAKQTKDTITEAFDKARKDLTKTDGYKSLPQEEKAKALNRLETDIKAIAYFKADSENPNDKYEPEKLTKNQQAFLDGTRTLEDYLISPEQAKATESKAKAKATAEKKAATTAAKATTVKTSTAKSSGTRKIGFKAPSSGGFKRTQSTAAIRKLLSAAGQGIKAKSIG